MTTHEVNPCTKYNEYVPCDAATAAVMRMLGYPVREVGEDVSRSEEPQP